MNIGYCAIIGFGLAFLLVKFFVWEEEHYFNNLEKYKSKELKEFEIKAKRQDEIFETYYKKDESEKIALSKEFDELGKCTGVPWSLAKNKIRNY